MFIKDYSDQIGSSDAHTLEPEYIGNNDSGWIITGQIIEDYYTWVNDFEAFHLEYGFVKGNFEDKVYASSEETLNQFLKDHPFTVWDYQDI